MTLARRCILAVCTALIFVQPMRADHPNTARGFDFAKPYQMHGLDNINLFNGNLTVTLPIGQRYQVNGNLSYGLTLVYSGNVWDTVEFDPTAGGQTRTYPSRRSNAGLGWYLSLGRLFPANTPPVQEKPVWCYESPDGGLHEFEDSSGGYWFTDDGTYLRLTEGTTESIVEFPDGTSQVFRKMARVANGTWTDDSSTGVWRLRQIKDRFDNVVNITYSSADAAPPSEPAYPEIWTIADGARTQKVYFIAATAPYELKVDHIELSTFAGTSTWRMAYVYRQIGSGGPLGSCSVYTVPLLSSLTLPTVEGVTQAFSMLDSGGQPNYVINTSCGDFYQTNGHLLGLNLPTGGALQWTYEKQQYFATEEGFSRSVAVKTRKMVAGTTTHTWNYARSFSGQQICFDPVNEVPLTSAPNQLTVSVTSPEQVTSVHYFSVNSSASEICGATGFDDTEYSMQFTRGVPAKTLANVPRHLSREIFTGTTPPTLPSLQSTNYRVAVPAGGARVRTEWVNYEFDGISSDNPRERAHVTYFGDDATNCGGTCEYTGVTRYGFDSFGHYRQSSTAGNLPGEKYRTTFVNYPVRQLTGTWILGTFSEKCAIDEATERTTLLTACNGLTAASDSAVTATAFCFNATTGFLERTRSLGGRNASHQVSAVANDLVAVYTSDHGNVLREDYYGGDAQTITGNVCTESLSSPQYSIEHSYQYGSRKTTRYLAAGGRTSPGFYTLNATEINANTGLIVKSKDVAEQETTYTYDAFGRVKTISPPGLAMTTASYPTATKAIATTPSATGNEVKTENEFDAFGRLFEERGLMKDGSTAKRRREYTGSGWLAKQYEWEATPTNYTLFEFDPFGRPVKITRPDNTSTTIAYEGGSKVTRTVSVAGVNGPLSSVTTETYDLHQRLHSVKEKSGVNNAEVTTGYTYDSADRLSKVCAGENGGVCQQERTFTYDGRGLLTAEFHPESQTTTYGGYDARGRVGHKYQGPSSSSFDHKYEYDAAERLTKVHQLTSRNPETTRPLKEFTFGTTGDTLNFTQGRLTQALRHNYPVLAGDGNVKVTESYGYDIQGQVKSKTTEIRSDDTLLQKFSQSYAYNNLGLLQTLTYPTCPDPSRPCGAVGISSISPSYQNGFLASVPGFATSIAYASSGMVKEIVHAGTTAMTDTIVPDASGMPRPKQIKFETYDTCTKPSIVQHPAGTPLSSGGSTTLYVAAATSSTTPLSYQWLKDGVLVPNENTSSLSTGPLTATTRYRARVINSCGMAESQEATVTVCSGPPTITQQPQSVPYPGSPVTLTVSASGCSTLSYQWYRGLTGDQNDPIGGAASSSYTTPSLTATARYWVKVTDSGGSTNSQTAVVTIPLPTPTSLNVYLTTPGQLTEITVSWQGCACAHHYEIERLSDGVWTTLTSQATSLPDGGRAPNKTYVYRVRAVDEHGGSGSPFTATELATTVAYSSITTGRRIYYADFDEGLGLVNMVRGAAGSVPLTWRQALDAAGYTTTEVPAVAGLIRKHLLALRFTMNEALAGVGRPTPAYTDTLDTPALIRHYHLSELQQRAQ